MATLQLDRQCSHCPRGAAGVTVDAGDGRTTRATGRCAATCAGWANTPRGWRLAAANLGRQRRRAGCTGPAELAERTGGPWPESAGAEGRSTPGSWPATTPTWSARWYPRQTVSAGPIPGEQGGTELPQARPPARRTGRLPSRERCASRSPVPVHRRLLPVSTASCPGACVEPPSVRPTRYVRGPLQPPRLRASTRRRRG